ncbi:TRAP transporter large permease [Anaerobacillus sp. MEB173]|uniref:TRAP transporter large permease n=1 Tax=Anaerobacillus sp. MEB173 TaxID=3383345 RepID=UPI003F8DF5E3
MKGSSSKNIKGGKSLLIIGMIMFIMLLIIGVPIWLTLGISGGFIALFSMGLPADNIPTHFFNATNSWILLAIPYFLLAGNLMTYLGSAKKMLGFIYDLVGHLPGGLSSAAVITATIFGALSGSATATVIAVGSMIIPQMIALGYSKENSFGVVAASGTLGSMIPPSIIMILYASIVQINVADLFIAGIIPGIFIAICLIITSIIVSFRENMARKEKSSLSKLRKSFLESIPALIMPVIVLGGIYTGVFTPTEAASIAIVYVLFISYFFNRKEFTLINIIQSLKSTMVTTSVIYIILGGATLFATSLTFAQVPQQITEFVSNLPLSSWLIMLVIILLLLILGTFLDAAPILFITVPILFPTVIELGYDPIHFGILVIACIMVGQITPPVGLSLFAISGHFKENLNVVVKGVIPYLYVLIIATIILLYVPWLSTFLVN